MICPDIAVADLAGDLRRFVSESGSPDNHFNIGHVSRSLQASSWMEKHMEIWHTDISSNLGCKETLKK
jgi:hypothetical protein